MKPINQKAKGLMEECKIRARDAGLNFDDDTLEYFVSNQDMSELSPKVFIPSLYDYWVQDVEVHEGRGYYDLHPSNPLETVVNTRPAISFYNEDNPDWMNVMIFYHVLGHIDFFQNNSFFEQTWNSDFYSKALCEKRLIDNLRSEHGRWVDYAIEFSRGIDNLVGYHDELNSLRFPKTYKKKMDKTDFYFNVFLQELIKNNEMSANAFLKEIQKYNHSITNSEEGEGLFLSHVMKRFPEFSAKYRKEAEKDKKEKLDLMQYISQNSEFLNKPKNEWMKEVMQVVRETSLYFAPQIRTKIMNEGWASHWHEKLFMTDPNIKGHEVAFAKINAFVTAIPKVGLNPYAIGMRLFDHIKELADKGKLDYDFKKIESVEERKNFDKKTGKGSDFIFDIRANMCDSTFINSFVDQDFVDKHNLFVTGKRLIHSWEGGLAWEYYIKSRKAEDYKQMLLNHLYHPPHITINEDKGNDGEFLYLEHKFEGKPLVGEYIPNTLLGIGCLWNNPVKLETSEIDVDAYQKALSSHLDDGGDPEDFEPVWRRVIYTHDGENLSKVIMYDGKDDDTEELIIGDPDP